ncbi:MAG: PilZ domain-containing protein [Acetobacteraceae bacterium]|nr:PilZ domain-containing protein [Acetobacteraceae bacterium]
MAPEWKRLSVLQPVALEVLEGDWAGRYTSVVSDLEGGWLAVATPTRQGHLIRPRIGTRVAVEHSRPDGVYRIVAQVARVEETPLDHIWLGSPESVQRTQRRGFVRLKLLLPLTYEVVSEKAAVPRRRQVARPLGAGRQVVSLPPHRLQGHTRDLSAGGALLVLSGPLKVGAELDLEIPLASGPPLRTRAEVLRVRPVSRGTGAGGRAREAGEGNVEAAVRFLGLEDRERDRIVAFLFDQEVKLRQKGLA